MKSSVEKQRIANNISLYIKLNGYTQRTFAKVAGISQSTMASITTGRMRNGNKFNRYIANITEQLGLEANYFSKKQEEITAAPIKFQDETKLHTSDEKFSALSLMLKIGEIHYK
ncbi:hypothetical protein [Listeria sp. PSOL-1]|uniref:hypothetical protein n=1 Tax=Listeria sp. PSOL-1 TaxID=1844999 RepID=UPI0013D1812A|nr:hypothetical protein [Listeria sp. PSOL-1]